MTVGEYCNRNVVVIGREESVAVAARLMREHHVGTVVIVDERDGDGEPSAILTDRDIVLEVVATGLDADELAVADVVTHAAYRVNENDSLIDALEVMRSQGVRRVPVVDEDGGLVGIISADDILGLMADMLNDLAMLVERQREREVERRP